MFSPLNRVQQQSSFLSKVGVPADGPMGPPYVYIYFNATWLPYVLGALQQLCQPGTWITASQAALESVLVIKRAGADGILTYFAPEIARCLGR